MSRSATFENQVAIVTGAGRGIGAATARMFAESGARVALLSRTESELSAQAEAIGSDRALAIPTDVSSESEVEAAFARVREIWGEPDHLVNNAGYVDPRPLVEMDVENWDRTLEVNLRGPFLCSRAFLRDRDPARGGSIVNVSSIAGCRYTNKFPGFAAYATSKAGLLVLTEVISAESRDLGVRVNAVSPGSTDTEMLRSIAPDLEPHIRPEEIARTILFACSPDASALRGTNIDAWG